MRHIHVEDGLRLRFPGRNEAFNEGVEIGLLVGHMASGRSEFTLRLASTTLEQARSLAASLSYRVHVVREQDGSVEAMFLTGRRRPNLRLVYQSAM